MLLTGIGRLGRNAEIRFTPSGEQVANLALAFNFGRKDDSGKRPVQWVDAALWGDRAKALVPYLVKGVALVVTISDPHVETYTTRDARSGVKLVGRVIDLEFAGGQPNAGAQNSVGAPPATPAPASTTPGSFYDFPDDVPF